jgi:selenoprotein W-related protein
LAAQVLERWEDIIEAVEVVPGTGGIFDVHVNDTLVFAKSMLGRYPQPDEVIPLLNEHLTPD